MLNKYPLWKYLLIAAVLLFGIYYSLPNLYPNDPAIQIRATQAGVIVNNATLNQATDLLEENDIAYFGEEVQEQSLLIRLYSNEDQLLAKSILTTGLGGEFVIALNLAPTTPSWLTALGGKPMALGLDLSGGVHFLMEVDMDKYIATRLTNWEADIKRSLREEGIRYRGVSVINDDTIQVNLVNDEFRDQANRWFSRNLNDFVTDDLTARGLPSVNLTLTEEAIIAMEDYAIQQNQTTLNNRVNEIGVAEPLVQRQGRNRIVVQLPGEQDTARAKNILGKSANLEYRLQSRDGNGEVFPFRDSNRTVMLERDVIVTGDNVTNATVTYDQNGRPAVSVTLDSAGGARMGDITKNNLNHPMGVLFIEQKSEPIGYEMVDGEQVMQYRNYEVKEVISLANIAGVFSSQFQTTGLDSSAEASELALLLRAGALAAPMTFVEERTVGPSLGAENIAKGFTSVVIGFALVIVFMVVFYKVFGIFASVALSMNLVLVIAIMSLLGATLTLPGIAGIVLTVGMAVDANVLIFSRIKEELNAGKPIQTAIDAGYGRAFLTILDANVTTFIVAIILYAIGTGSVKGFAVTLSVGILTSMFTAVLLTRALTNLVYGGRNLKKLPI
ncbi:protein translocase subunit SecD [Reinekea blandensis]|uniref:Protein translocase subunit SecD n=1 Tax=Reinekea blandensis MED297 TaxID=314283 RepID=A4BG49_9GAMM|nr:protein translocase subunit SecD [Reinekea blandensis]EAR08844.1 protein-export membrane protein SecD [Reinekea sp. MED297] [Reinekea blandensis MED297]